MADPDDFRISLLKSESGRANKRRELGPDGVIKTDHSLLVKRWRMASQQRQNDHDQVADLLRQLSPRFDITTVHGSIAPGIASTEWHPRWSDESRGSSRTLLPADRCYIPFDADKVKLAEGSAAGEGRHIVALAEQIREEVLPPEFRHATLVIRASSSTGLNPTFGSLHCYALLDRLVPLATIYDFIKGAQASGLPLDPRPALPGQLFLSARPEFVGLADPVPEDLRVFVLPGLQRLVRNVDWHRYAPQLAVRRTTERHAHLIGSQRGWRAALACCLGDGKGKLGFFESLSIAMGFAARSDEPVDEVIGAMHAIVTAHPDLNTERRGRYTLQWLHREITRLRAKDASREAQSDAIRRRLFPTMSFDR
jgi:hypothetical protein